jgi:hypothetical protein
VTWFFDPQHSSSVLSTTSSPIFDVNCDGVLGSPSSSARVPFCSISASWFASYLKLETHTHHHLNHFHFLAISCVGLLPMNIGPFCLSLTNIMLGVINESCNFDLLI